jgi:hypothetical protein
VLTEVIEVVLPPPTELHGEAVPPADLGELVAPEPIKRIVRREGIVRRSVSIQAPSYFVLESLQNRKTINYLHSTNVVLQDYYGARIAVTGEELLDERWPNMPVIRIDSIEAVP